MKMLYATKLTLKQLLLGTLNTSGAAPTTRTLTRTNAGDNKGCFTTVGAAPVEAATYIQGEVLDGWDVWVYTSGGSIVLNRIGPDDVNDPDIYLDDVLDGNWNQINTTYTISGVAAGVHKIGLRGTGAGGEWWTFGSIVVPQYPYQGVGVAGDTVEIIEDLDYFLTTFGIGRTNNGANCPYLAYGEGVIQRLPLGDGVSDQTATRGSVLPAGHTITNASTALFRRQWVPSGYWHATTKLQPLPAPRDTIKLSATAGTRGYRLDNAGTTADKGVRFWDLAASVYWTAVGAWLAQVTAVGAGSVLDVNDYVLAVVTMQFGAAGASPYMVFTNVNTRAVDLYKLAAA